MTTDIVTGGVRAGGLTLAEGVRRRGFTGSLARAGAGPRPPYERPPLSARVREGRRPAERAGREPGALDTLGAGPRLGVPATGPDLTEHGLASDDGSHLPCRTPVPATGPCPTSGPAGTGRGSRSTARCPGTPSYGSPRAPRPDTACVARAGAGGRLMGAVGRNGAGRTRTARALLPAPEPARPAP